MTNLKISERINWIGSSETPALLGVSPYISKFELWHQKKGNLKPEFLDDDERIQAGRFLEPAIAEWANHKWDDWSLLNVPGYLKHFTTPGLGASLDFSTKDTGLPVEIKNVDGWIFKQQWNAEGDVIVDAPLHHIIQVQTQLACVPDSEYGWLLVCVGGNKLYRMKVERHQGIIARIEAEVTEFWTTIDANQEPTIDWMADAEAVIAMHRLAGEEAVDLTDDNHLPLLCAKYQLSLVAVGAAEGMKKAAKAEILHIIGAADKALIGGGYTVTAGMVGETQIPATTRSEYRRFGISKKTDPTKLAEEIDP